MKLFDIDDEVENRSKKNTLWFRFWLCTIDLFRLPKRIKC